MGKHIVASWEFIRPMSREYVYPDGARIVFHNIVKVTVMSTGCQQLKTYASEVSYIIHPGWRYIIQERSKV